MVMVARVFKKTPHPDEEELKEIGMELGLRPVQVKFWFQNRRSQIKVILVSY